MEKLYLVGYADRKSIFHGMLTVKDLLPSIEGIVKESTLVTGDIGDSPTPRSGLRLKLGGRRDTFIFPHAQFRVDSGERVRIYAYNLAHKDEVIGVRDTQGLQILNAKGNRVLFQYKHGENLGFRD